MQVSVNRSFNQITVCDFHSLFKTANSVGDIVVLYNNLLFILLQVDGDTSTNDTVIALASGLSGLGCISSLDSDEALQLQACLDAVRLTLYNFITNLTSHDFILYFEQNNMLSSNSHCELYSSSRTGK